MLGSHHRLVLRCPQVPSPKSCPHRNLKKFRRWQCEQVRALRGGTRGALYSPLQEHGLQQEALGGRVGCTLSPHVLLHIASQVLGMGQTHLMSPLG